MDFMVIRKGTKVKIIPSVWNCMLSVGHVGQIVTIVYGGSEEKDRFFKVRSDDGIEFVVNRDEFELCKLL